MHLLPWKAVGKSGLMCALWNASEINTSGKTTVIHVSV